MEKKKCLVSKILKMDGNNQYGNVMTRPLLYGCIRKAKETPDLRLVNFVLQNLSVDDKISHLFVVDIILDEKDADQKN